MLLHCNLKTLSINSQQDLHLRQMFLLPEPHRSVFVAIIVAIKPKHMRRASISFINRLINGLGESLQLTREPATIRSWTRLIKQQGAAEMLDTSTATQEFYALQIETRTAI